MSKSHLFSEQLTSLSWLKSECRSRWAFDSFPEQGDEHNESMDEDEWS